MTKKIQAPTPFTITADDQIIMDLLLDGKTTNQIVSLTGKKYSTIAATLRKPGFKKILFERRASNAECLLDRHYELAFKSLDVLDIIVSSNDSSSDTKLKAISEIRKGLLQLLAMEQNIQVMQQQASSVKSEMLGLKSEDLTRLAGLGRSILSPQHMKMEESES